MTSANSRLVDKNFLANSMASFLQIGAVVLLLMWCFSIVKPFIGVVIWGVIIAVALYPAHVSLSGKLGSEGRSATLLVLIGLAIIIVPTWLLAESTIDGFQYVTEELEDGQVHIPPPGQHVAEWPIIGKPIYGFWNGLATNFADTVNRFQPQLVSVGQTMIGVAGGLVGDIFQFVFATIIGGMLLTSANSGYRTCRNVADSLAGDGNGQKLTDMSVVTIRSVVKGVLGVAIIQAMLAAAGLVYVEVPAAGLLAAIVLVLAIMQLPPWFVMLPVAIWYFSVAETVPATLFLVYAIFVSFSDAFLKPMLLGRGLETPMLVILIGAIGGMLTQGMIGLFIGAVVLAVGYELFTAWARPDEIEPEAVES